MTLGELNIDTPPLKLNDMLLWLIQWLAEMEGAVMRAGIHKGGIHKQKGLCFHHENLQPGERNR